MILKDRRKSPRFCLDLKANLNCLGLKVKSGVFGQIHNVSRIGVLISVDYPLHEGASVDIEVVNSFNNYSHYLSGDVVWVKRMETDNEVLCGVCVKNGSRESKNIEDLFSRFSENALLPDRRIGGKIDKFPLRRRQIDYLNRYFSSPYLSFFPSIEKLAFSKTIRTIIICTKLEYLKKKIRKVLPEPRIITSDKIDEFISDGTLVILSLDCRRRHEPFTFLDFDEYYQKCKGNQEPMHTLATVSRRLKGGMEIYIASLGEVKNSNLAFKYLSAAKFDQMECLDQHVIYARKRHLFSKTVHRGAYIVEEVESLDDVMEIQKLSADLYSKDYNFEYEIDSLFINYSDYYKIVNSKTGKILTGARVTWHLPNHFLPCMLANKKGTDLHLQLHNPDEISYGEIFAPYFNKFSTGKAYGELLKIFYSYGERKLLTVVLTTCNANNIKEQRFLARYLGFKDTEVNLTYGTFGGDWRLVFSAKDIFEENIRINFISPKDSPRMIEGFL